MSRFEESVLGSQVSRPANIEGLLMLYKYQLWDGLVSKLNVLPR